MNGNICAIFILYLQNLFVNNGEKHEKAWMGPFQHVIHVVQLRHAGEQYKRRNGRRQTKELTVLNDVSPLLVFHQCISYSSAW